MKIHNREFYDKLLEKTVETVDCLVWNDTETIRLPGKQQIFEELKKIKAQLGRTPAIIEWNELSEIHYETVLRRFKRWHTSLCDAEEFFGQS